MNEFGSLSKAGDMSYLPDEIPVDYGLVRYDPDNDGDDDTGESSFTLASTMYDFSYEHGRRYQSYRYGSHPFPHDDLSVKNDRILHHMYLFLFDNQLFLAPVQDPENVLDVRCAQGLWAENMAEAFPNANIVAMDTTPVSRTLYPNLSFLIQSFNDEWILDTPDVKFDFIYARSMFAHTGDFAQLYQQAFDNLKPGGYFEQAEVEIKLRCDDGSEIPDSVIHRLVDMVPRMSDAFGTEYKIADKMRELITKAGFVDVQETRYKLPLGPWSADPKYKQAGEYFEAFYKSGLQGWLMAPLTRNMGYTPEEVNAQTEEAFKEVDRRRQHLYFMAVVVHCRKPE